MSNEKIHFGKNGCTAIEVDPFTPICSHPDVDPSEPLTLDVPVPSFAPTVPPNECACFVFSRGTATEQVTTDCVDHGTATLTIDIAQADADCCTGRYSITPNLAIEMPCMPFTFAETDIRVRSRSGSTRAGDIDGNVNSMVLSKDCCTLTSLFDITLPDCVKGYDPLAIPNSQITCCDRDPDDPTKTVTKHFKLIEMVQDAARCSLYPKVNPITLPCCNQPDTVDDEHEVSIGAQGKIKWKIWREDCETKFSLSADPIQIGQASFCLANTSFNLQAKWTDEDGEPHTTEAAPVQITSTTVYPSECKKYNFSDLTLDLGTISPTGFSNGGDVDKVDDKKLRIDGDADAGKNTLFGGGYGDYVNNAKYYDTWRRGPIMRGGQESPAKVGSEYPTVTYANVGSAFVEVEDAKGAYPSVLATGVTKWESGRMTVNSETSEYTWDSQANLNIIWPTGAQWVKDGIALTLTEFEFNDSGVLSYAEEKQKAVVVAPAPAKTKSGGGLTAGLNASGLRVLSEADEFGRVNHGLRVDAGDGLRIYGIGDGSVASGDVDENRQGVLELQYGPGFRIRDYDEEKQELTFLNKPIDTPGSLMLNDGRGLRIHAVTKKNKQYPNATEEETYPSGDQYRNEIELHTFDVDMAFQKDDRLVFNDRETTNERLLMTSYGGYMTGSAFSRGGYSHYIGDPSWYPTAIENAECVIPVFAPHVLTSTFGTDEAGLRVPITDTSKFPTINTIALIDQTTTFDKNAVNAKITSINATINAIKTSITSIKSLLMSMPVMYLHVGKSGIILAIDEQSTRTGDTNIKRLADE